VKPLGAITVSKPNFYYIICDCIWQEFEPLRAKWKHEMYN